MEALVYTFLLIGTLIVIFFAVFLEKHLELLKNKTIKLVLFFNPHVLQMDHVNFLSWSKSCIDRICGNS
jgi:hypothetical protein